MIRFFLFLINLFLPMIFGWWLFIPLSLFSVYLIKFPYEIIFIGFILDLVYYFGVGFWYENALFVFTITLIILVWFLDKKISWQKKV